MHALWWVNIALQVCDGIATYHGLQHGLQEGNPLIRMLMECCGVEWALFVAKFGACALLVSLRVLGLYRLRARALLFTAVSYVALSILPWVSLFFGHNVG